MILFKHRKIIYRCFCDGSRHTMDNIKRKVYLGNSFFKFAVIASLSQSVSVKLNYLHIRLSTIYEEISKRNDFENYYQQFIDQFGRNAIHDEVHGDFETVIKLKVGSQTYFSV